LFFNNPLFAVILTQSVVDDYITKEQTIRNYVFVYVLETADIPDKTELSTYFNLNTSLFTNLYGEINQLDFTINSANSLVLNYPIYSQHTLISTKNKTLYLHSTKHNPLTVITADYSSNTTTFDGKTINVINFIKNLMLHETAGTQTHINHIYTDWYYPNGDGTFKRYSKNSSGFWVVTDFNSNVSVLSFNESTFNKNEVYKNDDIVLVTNTNSMVEYICIKGKWYEKNAISENDKTLFDGYSTLQNLVCTMWSNAGGSIVHDIVVHPFTGTKTNFTKFDDSDGVHEGYWISDDNTHVVTKNMRDLIHYRAKYGTQTTGYMCLNNTVIYAKWLSMNGTTQWFYIWML